MKAKNKQFSIHIKKTNQQSHNIGSINAWICCCKVEFYQTSCWLYSVSNLLVFQQLVTLYLGEIFVRVVSEIV